LAIELQQHIDRYKLRGGNPKIIAERAHIYEERTKLAQRISELKKVSFPPLVDSWPIESVNGH
jgi:hypothetical protein